MEYNRSLGTSHCTPAASLVHRVPGRQFRYHNPHPGFPRSEGLQRLKCGARPNRRQNVKPPPVELAPLEPHQQATFEAAVKLYRQGQDLDARMAAMQATCREAREQFEAILAQLER